MSTDKIKEIKYFKRVLKELGIYKLWMKERSKQINLGQSFFSFKTNNFHVALDESITWNETNNCEMWCDLYCASYLEDNNLQILENDKLMNHLKEIVNKYA